MLIGKGEVVEGVMQLITEHEDRDHAVVLRLYFRTVFARVLLTQIDAEQRAPRASGGQFRLLARGRIGVAGSGKKNVRNLESGSQAIFSGRLNGVAPAAFAANVATNGTVSPARDLVDGHPLERP